MLTLLLCLRIESFVVDATLALSLRTENLCCRRNVSADSYAGNPY